MNRMNNTYTCSRCHQIYEFDDEWSEEDAKNEVIENGWGDIETKDMVIICDDCYKEIVER